MDVKYHTPLCNPCHAALPLGLSELRPSRRSCHAVTWQRQGTPNFQNERHNPNDFGELLVFWEPPLKSTQSQ